MPISFLHSSQRKHIRPSLSTRAQSRCGHSASRRESIIITLCWKSLSLNTLIDGLGANRLTGYIYEGYEYSDQSLYVGFDDAGLRGGDFPDGCALMMQYQGQTFPVQWTLGMEDSSESAREESRVHNTPSCSGVLDVSCQSAIVEIIWGVEDSDGSNDGSNINSSQNGTSGDKCSRLMEHVNAQLRSDEGTWGQSSWMSNFLNVTGGSLQGPATTNTAADDEQLGNDECRPVLPQSYSLSKVADMRLYYIVEPPEGETSSTAAFSGVGLGFRPL
ncbi:hypothetical protein BJX65DRAFT_271683 [Aspergillus insuetus]